MIADVRLFFSPSAEVVVFFVSVGNKAHENVM